MAENKQAPSDGQQGIEVLQQRYSKLNTRKIQAETNLQSAEQRLDALKMEAREKYQTDDVEELRKLLESMKRENEEKRKNYQADLDRIEGELAAVEQKFAAAESSSDKPAP